jgi:acyl-CoA reductase-like NAD-dependent aldehyde dehydrogenase
MASAAGTLKRVSLQCGGKAPSLVFADCQQSGAGRELGPAGLGEYVAHKRIAFDASPAFHLKTWWQRRDRRATGQSLIHVTDM